MHVNHIRLANPEHSCPPFSTPLFKWNKTVSSHQQWHSQFRNPAASIKPDWRHSFEVRLTVDLLTPSLCCAILCQLSTLFRLPLICFCLCCLGFCFYLVLSAPLSLFPLCLRLRCFEFFNSSTRKAFPGQHPLSFFFLNSCWWLSDKSALVGAYVRFKEEPAFLVNDSQVHGIAILGVAATCWWLSVRELWRGTEIIWSYCLNLNKLCVYLIN